jgi:hypothetical protein
VERSEPGRGRWLRRTAVALYITSVTAVVALLIVLGEDVLAGWVAAVEICTSAAIAIAVRRPPSPASKSVHRLGTPNDPGMPSGR